MERLDTSAMTDTIREAFERWCYDAFGFNSNQLVMLQGAHLFDAWQQSRREALMEAAAICEQVHDEYQKADQFKYPEMKSDAESGCTTCEWRIRAAAEEEGK